MWLEPVAGEGAERKQRDTERARAPEEEEKGGRSKEQRKRQWERKGGRNIGEVGVGEQEQDRSHVSNVSTGCAGCPEPKRGGTMGRGRVGRRCEGVCLAFTLRQAGSSADLSKSVLEKGITAAITHSRARKS